MRRLTASALILAHALPVAAQTPSEPVQTIAEYPNGSFLENLSLGEDGTLLVTSYADKRLLAWTGSGAPSILAQLDAHPVGILARANDVIVSAHGLPFTAGPAFVKTNRLLVLDKKGAVISSRAAPEALFLNGLVELAPDRVLAADSLAGRIWSFNPKTGAIETWLADPLLATVPDKNVQRPGANGLKLRGDWLYVSNSSRGALYRAPIRGGKPAGPLELVATTGPIDDFAFLADGSIAATTHGAKLLRIAADGAVSAILEDGCDACTSVTPIGDGGEVIVLTTGNLLEGGKEPARILRVAAPAAANR